MKHENKKKDLSLYSIYFPFYAFLLLDYGKFVPMIPINLAVTAVILWGILYFTKTIDWKNAFKKSYLKTFLFGILADLMGVLFRFLPLIFEKFFRLIGWNTMAAFLRTNCSDMVLFNIYCNTFGLVYTVISILVAGVFVFIFNYNFALKEAIQDKKKRRIASIVFAILTAPYSFMNPYW